MVFCVFLLTSIKLSWEKILEYRTIRQTLEPIAASFPLNLHSKEFIRHRPQKII